MSNYGAIAPVPQESTLDLFSIPEHQRAEYLQSLGARNAAGPLAPSSHLRIKSNGRVLPYDDMLAEQVDLVECCDEHGNTDPRMWAQQPPATAADPAIREELVAIARERLLSRSAPQATTYRQPGMGVMEPQDMEYPDGVVPYDKLEELLANARG